MLAHETLASRGYSEEQAAKISGAYVRLVDAGESVTVHKLRAEAKTGLAAVQAWLAANADSPGIDVPAVPAEDLAGILQPLWTRAWTLATEATEQAAAETAAALRTELAAADERAEAAEAQVAELTAALEQARQAAAGAEALRADLAAARAHTDAATERAERAEAQVAEQLRMLGDLIRRESEQ
ncbi:MAG TPA: hypothetical protein PKA99_12450 [Dermatophilaceae bacterium]|nr:hypothetical protein [Dermatophilaceae bacterium]